MNGFGNWIKHLTDGEVSFWGSVVGAVIGVLGALGVGLLGVLAERLFQKRKAEKDMIRSHGEKVVELEIFLNQYITTQIKNERLLRKCTELETPGHFMMTLPRVMQPTLSQEGNLINKQLLNEFVSLEISINLNNQMVEDFVDNYKRLSDFLMPLLAQKQTRALDQEMIVGEYAKLREFAESVRKSTNAVYERSLKVMAIVHLHGEKSETRKFKHVKELANYIVSDNAIQAKIEKIRKTYSEESMFKDV